MKGLLDEFKTKRVLVFGDIMLDEYIIGDAERISPEAPIPVVLAKEQKFVLGGAANTANNIASLGAKAVLCGLVGKDSASEKIIELLKLKGIENSCVIDSERKTTRKTRIIARQQQMLRIDQEETRQIGPGLEKQFLEKLAILLPSVDAVVVSDYAKGVLTKKIVKRLLLSAKLNKKIVCVDSKNFVGLGFKNADLLKPNKSELAKETGLPCRSLEDCKIAAKKLFSKLKPKALLVTLGADGMLLLEEGKVFHIKSRAIEVFDISGAGDTVIATAALALCSGASYLEAAETANFAASVVIRKIGTATLALSELKEAMENSDVAKSSFSG